MLPLATLVQWVEFVTTTRHVAVTEGHGYRMHEFRWVCHVHTHAWRPACNHTE